MSCDFCGKRGPSCATKSDNGELCDSCLLSVAEQTIKALRVQNKGLRTRVRNLEKSNEHKPHFNNEKKTTGVVINTCYGRMASNG